MSAVMACWTQSTRTSKTKREDALLFRSSLETDRRRRRRRFSSIKEALRRDISIFAVVCLHTIQEQQEMQQPTLPPAKMEVFVVTAEVLEYWNIAALRGGGGGSLDHRLNGNWLSEDLWCSSYRSAVFTIFPPRFLERRLHLGPERRCG